MITLILLFTAHYLGDFTPLMRPYMLQAKTVGNPIWPIVDHALVHAALVFIVLWGTGFNIWVTILCAIVEAVSHFGIDLLKSKVNIWFPSVKATDSPWYWPILGFDQLLHATILIFIAKICNIV